MNKKYIKFRDISELKQKTKKFLVVNISSDYPYPIGEIKWYSQWRQYCFFPDEETIYSVGCLKEINDFINRLMEEKKRRYNQNISSFIKH